MKGSININKTTSFAGAAVVMLVALLHGSLVHAEANIDEFTIADNSPIVVEEKGLTIIAPEGWKVLRNRPGITLQFRSPDGEDAKYPRYIDIRTFKGAKYVDELEAEKLAPVIVHNFSEASGTIENYRIRNMLPVDLESGIPGYLFYSEFKVNDLDLMQMHILVSAADRHYIMTFTDLAEYFNTDNGPAPHLNEAWKSLGSIQLQSKGPIRFTFPLSIMAAMAFFGLVAFFTARYRSRRAGKRYGAEMKKLESDDLDDYVPSQQVSKADAKATQSRVSTMREKPITDYEEIIDQVEDELDQIEDDAADLFMDDDDEEKAI